MFKVEFIHPVHGHEFIICDSINSEDDRIQPMVCLSLKNKSSITVLTTTVKHISIYEKY